MSILWKAKNGVQWNRRNRGQKLRNGDPRLFIEGREIMRSGRGICLKGVSFLLLIMFAKHC